MLLRSAVAEDAMGVAGVHVRSWQTAYRTLLPEEYLNQLRAEDRAVTYDFANSDSLKPRTIVAAEGGSIYGFATTMPSRDSDLKNCGELCALYVDPLQWGRGVGAALVLAARTQLLESGFHDAALWVLSGNVRAERFYEKDGWVPDGSRKRDQVWGITVDEIRYRRRLMGV